MKLFQFLVAILAALMILDATVVAGSSTTEVADENQSQLHQIQVDGEEERKRVLSSKPPPKKPSSGSSGSGGSSGSSGGSGGSSGGSGGSSGGSGGGSGSGGSGGGGGGGGSGGSASALSSNDLISHKAKKNLALMLSIAAVAGMAIAAVAIPRRQIATEKPHPLKGSLNKRIDLFSNLAKHASVRPPRRDEDGRYINADSIV